MKINKRIVKYLCFCIVLGIIVQNSILYYFNKKYEKGQLKIKAIKVENNTVKKTTPKIKLDNKAYDIKPSFNAKYISYFVDGNLKILDAYNNNVNDINHQNCGKIVFSKWIYGENSMILVEKHDNYFNFYSYDAKKKFKRELLDFDMNKFKIKIKNNNDKIEDIVSSDTNFMYIKVLRATGLSDIYKVNIMNQISLVKSNILCNGNIAVPPNGTSLVYKSKNTLKILTNDLEKDIPVKESEKLQIIGIDKNNMLYLAYMNNDKAEYIYRGLITNNSINFTYTKIKDPIPLKQIILDKNGTILLNNSLKGELFNLTENKSYKYKGIFLGKYDNGIVTDINGELNFSPLKFN